MFMTILSFIMTVLGFCFSSLSFNRGTSQAILMLRLAGHFFKMVVLIVDKQSLL